MATQPRGGEPGRGRDTARGFLHALGAALLFGSSTPFIRPALATTDPAASAGYLYLGQALILTLLWTLSRRSSLRREVDLGRSDLTPLTAGIVAGGIIAPGAFTAGLALVAAHKVSLLLGLEIVFTLVIALVFRHERLGVRAWAGVLCLIAAGLVVSISGRDPAAASSEAMPLLGALLVCLACLGWAVDSNVTAGISGKDPTAIALLKGWVAAAAYLGGCLVAGRSIAASGSNLLLLLVAGALGYGLSLRFFILALRHLGAALTTAVFSTAPLAGFAVSVAIYGERPAPGGWAAFLLAAVGVATIVTARHDHTHVHESLEHAHPHVHDEHHRHVHPAGVAAVDGHSHPHVHERLEHSHPHVSDIHHTHRH